MIQDEDPTESKSDEFRLGLLMNVITFKIEDKITLIPKKEGEERNMDNLSIIPSWVNQSDNP